MSKKIAKVKTSVISGINAIDVSVEADLYEKANKFNFSIIGLADTAIREAKHRVVSALRKTGVYLQGDVLINLSPAEIKKEGASFDLPIAVALLEAKGAISCQAIQDYAFYGELALDGGIKPIKGMIAHSVAAKIKKIKKILVPLENYNEARLINGIEIFPVRNLSEVLGFFRGSFDIESNKLLINNTLKEEIFENSLADVQGQEQAKRALTIAAVGRHNLLFVGPPGCGKSMLAERLPSLLPPMSNKEIIEVAKIYSIAGIEFKNALRGVRPFRAPHYVTSDTGLIGGGAIPKPGEISLAHNGILFLDEFPEYNRKALEALRIPLEKGRVLISRAKASFYFPANFQLIAAMNPCPCGKLGSIGQECLCHPQLVSKYLQKISQPIIDRIDLQVSLDAVRISDLKTQIKSSTLAEHNKIKTLIQKAIDNSFNRQKKYNAYLNNEELTSSQFLDSDVKNFYDAIADRQKLSVRGYFRALKVARTIADLENSEKISKDHISEACSYRSLNLIKDYIER